MDFNANSITESCVPLPQDSCVDLAEFYGKEFTFFHGVEQRILLPSSQVEFAAFDSNPKLLRSIDCWCRLYRYPGPGIQNFALVASICIGEEIKFDIIRFAQKDGKKGKRSPIVFEEARSLDRKQLEEWLITLATTHFRNRDGRNMVMQRPPVVASPLPRIAWVGQPILAGTDLRINANAIGSVYGTEIVHLYPSSFRGTMSDLKDLGSLDAVYLDASVAIKFGDSVVPDAVPRGMVFKGQPLESVSDDLRAVSELVSDKARSVRLRELSEEDQVLCVMIRPMLSHSKIGQFSHCDRETLLSTVRAKRLNMPLAEQLLTDNSEKYSDTEQSGRIFLWKAHNDGDQYFLNPRRVADCRNLVERIT
jgi:hypothetical protein